MNLKDQQRECERWRGQLTAYLAGELPGLDADAVRRHLETCADCRALADELAKSLDLARSALADPALAVAIPRALTPERRAQVLSASARTWRSASFERRFLLPAAAAALLIAAFMGGWYLTTPGRSGDGGHRVAVAADDTKTGLADDSTADTTPMLAISGGALARDAEIARHDERPTLRRLSPEVAMDAVVSLPARPVAAPAASRGMAMEELSVAEERLDRREMDLSLALRARRSLGFEAGRELAEVNELSRPIERLDRPRLVIPEAGPQAESRTGARSEAVGAASVQALADVATAEPETARFSSAGGGIGGAAPAEPEIAKSMGDTPRSPAAPPPAAEPAPAAMHIVPPGVMVPATDRERMQNRLSRIVLPEVRFEEANLPEVMAYLSDAASPASPREGRGVAIATRTTPNDVKITLALRNVSLWNLMLAVADVSALQLRVEGETIVFEGPERALPADPR